MEELLSIKLVMCQELIWVSSEHFERQNMHQIATIFVPHLLIEEQKEYCVNTCHDLQEALERDSEFLLKIITCDETCYWVQPRNKAGGISVEEYVIRMSKNARQKSAQT